MKRILILVLCLTLGLTPILTACGGGDEAESTPSETTASGTTVSERETDTAAPDTETVPVIDTDTETDMIPETEIETETETETAPETETETIPETETETIPETEPDTEAETEPPVPVAGTDSGIVRDGTPKKYFTLAFDDGITQDLQIIELLKKYDMDCCTFYINSGLTGANWTWVADMIGRPVTHQRFTTEELLSGIYDGFDIEVHTLTHLSLSTQSKRTVQREVQKDAATLTEWFGVQPVGMAWPGGDGQYTNANVKVILEKTDIRFARGTTSTYGFALPSYFMTWYPTVSIVENNVLTLAQQFIDTECTEDMLFYVWGHGYELDGFSKWETLDQLLSMMSDAANSGEVILVTQAEFYQLFKDEIPSWGDEAQVK